MKHDTIASTNSMMTAWAGPWGISFAANLTPDKETGIGEWSEEEITMFMLDGMLPDGDYAGGAMSDVIDHNTAHLTEDDRRAIAKYLKSLPPIPRQPDD